MMKTQLGIFTNFPTIIHGFAKFTYKEHVAKIQRTIVRAFYKFNGSNETYMISPASRAGTYQGTLGFEVGIAEGTYFNNLNEKMTEKLYRSITPWKHYPILDFLIIVTYHYKLKRKKVNLNFDYNHLRFIFSENELEVRLFHSKGTRRMPLDELISRIMNSINQEMEKRAMEPFSVIELYVL